MCSIPQFRLASTPTQYGKVQHTSSSCVLLSPVTMNVRYDEIYLHYFFYNLLVHIIISNHSFYELVAVLYKMRCFFLCKYSGLDTLVLCTQMLQADYQRYQSHPPTSSKSTKSDLACSSTNGCARPSY